jgi:predicted dehydrogenase
MTEPNPTTSRRSFLGTTGLAAAGSALAGVAIPAVHAAEDNTIRVALIGCGGRGTGAAGDALSTRQGPIKLAAMADVFEDRLSASYDTLVKEHKDKVDVSCEHKFIGFDAYKHAMDVLKPGDVVILATPPAFRWVHFTYAIQKGLHTFMEKPVTVDGPTTRRMLALGEEAKKKNLKVGVGLMCRHCEARGELLNRINDGEIGDIVLLRAYRQTGPVGSALTGPKPDGISELLYQIKRFHAFLWASGGCFSDFLIHNIDECCWMKGGWPISAKGSGARCYRGEYIDQNFDTYSVEYTFADGSKLFLEGRNIDGCHQEFASYAHGTKGSAVISSNSHSPARCRIYKGQNMRRSEIAWAFPQPEPNPYQVEWDDLIHAIRKDKLYNEVKRGAEASLVTSMGRMAAHTGQVVTFDDMLNCKCEFAPDVDKLTMTSPAPLQVDKLTKRYPAPQPGIVIDREYLV